MVNRMRCVCHVIAVFVLGFAGVAQAQSQDAPGGDVESLRQSVVTLQAQVADLQARLSRLSSAALPNSSEPAAMPTAAANEVQMQQASKDQLAAELNQKVKRDVGKSVANYETYSNDTVAAARVDNAPLDPRYPSYFRLPGTQTLLKIGGYFKTDFIRDIRPAGDTDRFIPATIP